MSVSEKSWHGYDLLMPPREALSRFSPPAVQDSRRRTLADFSLGTQGLVCLSSSVV